MYFEFRIRLEPLLKSIPPIFPFLLCSPLPFTFPSVSTLQERTQQNHRPNNQHWTRAECRNLGLPPSSSIYALPFPLEKPSKSSHWSHWFWLWVWSMAGMAVGMNWRASCSFVIRIKVVYVLHFNFFKIPEWRVRGAAAEDGA
jgi:hypothetical protein